METMGTGSFPGIKRPGRGVDHPPPSSAEVKERVELYLYSLWAFMACSRENFAFTLYGKHACPSVRGLVSAVFMTFSNAVNATNMYGGYSSCSPHPVSADRSPIATHRHTSSHEPLVSRFVLRARLFTRRRRETGHRERAAGDLQTATGG
jgi:hypothetical protein